jgi:hypothetical protein
MTSPGRDLAFGPFGRPAKATIPPAMARARAAGAVRLSGLKQASLSAVSVVSATNAWAAGSFCASGCGTASEVDDTLIMHWNGTTWSRVASPSPSSSYSVLDDVSAVAANDLGAVVLYCASTCGTTVDRTLILHWNGATWSQVPSPSPSASFNWLYGVSAVSATDAWAVGQYCTSNCTSSGQVFDSLVLHWNGTAWSKRTSPNPSKNWNNPIAVAASSTGAWVVGDYTNKAGRLDALILHWNGTTWSQVISPNPGSADALDGIVALPASKAWAVGVSCVAACTSQSPTYHSLILRWNGTRWSAVTSPNPGTGSTYLNHVTAVSGKNAWAVGDYCVSGCGGSAEVWSSLSLHWNGTTWSQSATPDPSARANFLYGSSAASATDAWAVGQYCASTCSTTGGGFFSGNFHMLILHWNGTAWKTS